MSCEFTIKIKALENELAALRLENEKLRKGHRVPKIKIDKVRCPCVTGKGTQCMKFCMEGAKTCKVHSKPPKEPKRVKPPREKKKCCTGINIRGNPCKRPCLPEFDYCERHDPAAPKVVSKVKRNKQRDIPKHNHKPSEVPVTPCTLCDTHGDIFNQTTCVSIVEIPGKDGLTLRDRLKNVRI
jgi:hypothetical protein